MKFVEINNLKRACDVKKLYQESFPVEEQVEFEKLFSEKFENYKIYAIYEENDALVAMVHFNELKSFVHVNYLAVKKECQSKGYGSAFLTFIKNLYKKPLVLDVEELDQTAPNNINRIKRIKFYKNNGFKEGVYKFVWQGVLMTYMHTQNIDANEFMEYIQTIYPTIKNIEKK